MVIIERDSFKDNFTTSTDIHYSGPKQRYGFIRGKLTEEEKELVFKWRKQNEH